MSTSLSANSNDKPVYRWRDIVIRLLKLAILAAIFYFVGDYMFTSWNRLDQHDLAYDHVALSCSLLFLFGGMFVFASAWHVLLKFHHQQVSFFQSVLFFFLSQLGKYIPGKVWTVTGRIGLCVEAGLDPVHSSSAVIYEQILLLIASSTLGGAGVFFWLNASNVIPLPTLLIVTVSFFFIAHPFVLRRLLALFCKLLKKNPIDIPMTGVRYVMLFFLYLLGHLLLGLSFFFSVLTFSPISISLIPLSVCIFAGSWAIGYASLLAPAGIGVREGILLTLLKSSILPQFLIAAVVLHRLLSVFVDLFSASLLYFLRRFR